ncbi:MAG: DUF4395 domain-containing protein [Gemmatimonadaceae bacterium]
MLRELVCPVSAERVDQRVVRIVAGEVALLTIIYLASGWLLIPMLLSVDFAIRGFGSGAASPLRAGAAAVARWTGAPILIDRAPKIFAARVGLLFSVAIVALGATFAIAASIVASVLLVFALLESLLNICAGCLVYSYVVLPLTAKKSRLK